MTLSTKIAIVLIALLVLAATGTIVWLKLSVANLQTELAQSQSNYMTCKIANDEFTATVKAQNNALTELKQQTTQREEAATRAIITANKVAKSYTDKAAALQATKQPSNDCKAVEDFINSFLKGAK